MNLAEIPRHLAWPTSAELSFIDKLGSFSHSGAMPRHELLQRYLEGCEKRRDWGDMDRVVVERHARQLLKQSKGH